MALKRTRNQIDERNHYRSCARVDRGAHRNSVSLSQKRTKTDYGYIVGQGEEPRLSPVWISAIEEYIDVLLGPQRTRPEILHSVLKDVGKELGDNLILLPKLYYD